MLCFVERQKKMCRPRKTAHRNDWTNRCLEQIGYTGFNDECEVCLWSLLGFISGICDNKLSSRVCVETESRSDKCSKAIDIEGQAEGYQHLEAEVFISEIKTHLDTWLHGKGCFGDLQFSNFVLCSEREINETFVSESCIGIEIVDDFHIY